RMFDREMRGMLFPVRHWITANAHHFTYELVRLNDSGRRTLDESLLHAGPLIAIMITLRGSERPDVEGFHFFGTGDQFLLRTILASGFSQRTVIFSSKMFSQPRRASAAQSYRERQK